MQTCTVARVVLRSSSLLYSGVGTRFGVPRCLHTVVLRNVTNVGARRKGILVVPYGIHNVPRNASTASTSKSEVLDELAGWVPPDAPAPPTSVDETVVGTAIQETLEGLRGFGLGSYFTPVGWVQHVLDLSHTYSGASWFATIVSFTITVRLVMFPLFAMQRRTQIENANSQPALQRVLKNMTDARASGDQRKIAQTTFEYQMHLKENNPFKMGLFLFPNALVFGSTFIALRRMAEANYTGLVTGGALWFPDLTVGDLGLQLISCGIIGLTILAAQYSSAMTLPPAMSPYSKLIKTAAPIALPGIVFTFLYFIDMQSAGLTYMCVSNFITLVYSIILNSTAAKQFFRIPERNAREDADANVSQFSIVEFVSDRVKRDQGYATEKRIQKIARNQEQLIEEQTRRFRNLQVASSARPRVTVVSKAKSDGGADEVNTR